MSAAKKNATRTPKGRHVTGVDLADAAMLVDIITVETPMLPTERKVAAASLARFLADKREEWIACAMIRAERTFRIKRRDGT